MIPEGLAFALNTSILLTELPLLERPAAAAANGFVAIESWWPFEQAVPNLREVQEFVVAVQEAELRLIALNFFAGDMKGGERGIVSVPGREQEFRDSVAVVVSIAEQTGCRAFNALYGQRLEGVAADRQDNVAVDNLVFAAEAVAPLGGTVLVEPLTAGENGAYPLLTCGDALAVIDRVVDAGPGNVALLADVYHLARNGDDPVRVIWEDFDRVGHVQIADVPGRHEPGTGSLDFGEIFRVLVTRSYAGYVALEYRPSGASTDSFDWLPMRYRAQRRPH